MKKLQLTDWLPTTRKEMDLRGWDCADVIIFSGDAYVDHPSFGTAVIGRIIEARDCAFASCRSPTGTATTATLRNSGGRASFLHLAWRDGLDGQ